MNVPINSIGSEPEIITEGTYEGLSQTRVIQIVHDDQGFMWFGSQYGLNRYDGYTFKVFKHEPGRADSLSGVFIYSLFKDRSFRRRLMPCALRKITTLLTLLKYVRFGSPDRRGLRGVPFFRSFGGCLRSQPMKSIKSCLLISWRNSLIHDLRNSSTATL